MGWGGGPGGARWEGGADGTCCGAGWAGWVGGAGGLVGRNVCTLLKGVRVCGVKNELLTAEDRKNWRIMAGIGEDTYELEKNAKMLDKKNTIIVSMLCDKRNFL